MKNGFIKAAAASPELRVADVKFNTDKSIECIKKAAENGAKLIGLPELGLTAYTCGDLFLQSSLTGLAEEELIRLAEETAGLDILSVVGLPVSKNGKLYSLTYTDLNDVLIIGKKMKAFDVLIIVDERIK